MSRNKEKAQSALNRFQEFKNREAGVLESNPSLRPKRADTVNYLPQARKWKSVVMSEISTKMTDINDPNATELQLRDLNDKLNKLFWEKENWESQINILSGGNPNRIRRNRRYGQKAPADSEYEPGYQFFGRARELPDAKKFLENERLEKQRTSERKRKAESTDQSVKRLNQRIDLAYYGYYDEDPCNFGTRNIFNKQEREQIIELAHKLGEEDFEIEDETDYGVRDDIENINDRILRYEGCIKEERFYSSLDDPSDSIMRIQDFELEVPSSQHVQQWMLTKRKKELLAKLGMEK
ncbi:predicted protein [Scheffersomyces stipitis CBS 6054]|uniref:Pre-mRNA-splicing factor ISY1 n=1 Tax=Scheffersomyces stipitis (strain ATCC 58785 / CBS 6054 / NBRC 10063 / NRRL Y-11545) TaxID=322104 RepID=A3LY75_PICST|nr:predicted protein [Scheffersomyces stipitis CBS 6054]ABN67587.2 predicted protein [Scheffersomyces stipitis CBS 6054]